MKMKSNNIALILSVFLLSACGGPSTPPKTIPLSQLTDKYSSTNRLQIDFWSGFGVAMSTEILEIIAAFEMEYPFIKVNYETKNSYDALHTAIVL